MPDLTAAGLYELVKEWPEEARPEGCYTIDDPPMGWFMSRMADPIPVPHAIALHEASGLRWLAGQGWWPMIAHNEGPWSVIDGSLEEHYQTVYREPTLLHAIDAAIKGVG